jgi:hypothetical protein
MLLQCIRPTGADANRDPGKRDSGGMRCHAKGRSDERCGLEFNARQGPSGRAICPRLRRSAAGSTNFRRPNVPMTVRDLMPPGLGPPELEPPNSVPTGREWAPVWEQEPGPVLARPQPSQVWVPRVPPAWLQQAWLQQAWLQQAWEPPSFLPGSSWRWPFWRIFSVLPPWTFWRISSQTS